MYTPKHGSWLNMAEIELHVLTGQCLNRRIDDIEIVRKEVAAWQKFRNNKNTKVNWQFTTENARIKLSRLYQTLESWRDTSLLKCKQNTQSKCRRFVRKDGPIGFMCSSRSRLAAAIGLDGGVEAQWSLTDKNTLQVKRLVCRWARLRNRRREG